MAKIKYNGKEYDEPNAAWSLEAPAMYRETPESLEQRWTAGYGGAGYKQALANYDNLSPLEQDILNNVTAKGQAAEAAAGSSGGYGGNYGGSGGYQDSYAGQIKSITDKIMNRGPFSYDYQTDPLYQQYAKEYTRLGQRAMDDTLAKVSARTGGLASSYAASAGNQAYENYMQQLSNKIPELYKLAYDMYNDDYNRDLNRLNLLRGLDSDAYGRFASERAYGDSRADLDYNRALDAENLAYQRAWNEENRDYTRQQAARGDQLDYAKLLYGYNQDPSLLDAYYGGTALGDAIAAANADMLAYGGYYGVLPEAKDGTVDPKARIKEKSSGKPTLTKRETSGGNNNDDTLDYDSIKALGYDINDPKDGSRLAQDVAAGRVKQFTKGGKLSFVKAGSSR